MTSLQRALAAKKPSKGAFETVFAGGLDLSEFSTGTTTYQKSDGTPKSAAAELLRIKAEERKQRDESEAADRRMEEIVKKRVSNLEQCLNKERPSNNIVVDALVKMHGSDVSAPSYRQKRKSGPRKSGSSKTGTSQSSKSHTFKKPRRIKH
jgi:hypothetical protein